MSWAKPVRALGVLATVLSCILALPAAAQTPTLTIPVVLPLSGGTAFVGLEMQRSLDVLQTILNASGGVKGRPVRFDFRDDESSPQTAVQVTQQLMASKPPVIIGSAIVAQCLAMEPLTRGTTVQYCISPGVHPRYGDYLFSAGFSTAANTVALLRYFGARGLKRVVTITSIDATGQDADRELAAAAAANAKSGVSIVDAEHFNPSDPSVTAQMERIKAAHPDAIVAWTTGPAFGTVLHAYAEAGLHVPVATTNGNVTIAAMKQFAAYLPDELLFPAPQFVVGPTAGSAQARRQIERYVDALRAAHLQNDYQVGVVWDPAMLAVDAVRDLGFSASGTQIRDYILRQHHWVGLMGTYDFANGEGSQRGLLARDVVIVRWNKSTSAWVAVSKPGGLP